MIGISKKELEDMLRAEGRLDIKIALNFIIQHCHELNPWIPLEEFLKSGFIGACWVYTDTEFVYTAYYAKDGQFYESDFTECRLGRNTIVRVMPLHKPESPQDD